MAGSIAKNLRKAKALAKKNTFSEAAEVYIEILKKFSKNQRAKQVFQELITYTEEEHDSLIFDFAEKPKMLQAIKEKLSINRLSTPLFDSELYTKNIERAYKQVYQNYLNDNNAKVIDLSKT